jgi:hypothetical protein
VLADEVELARVVSNLLENARRYGKTPETGIAVVDIAAKARDEWVLLKVRDHGMGVPPEQLPNLTKPFFRGDAARTAATGAGLGLAIVDKTVQRMGGILRWPTPPPAAWRRISKLQKPKPEQADRASACSAAHQAQLLPAGTRAPGLGRASFVTMARCRSNSNTTARASMASPAPPGPGFSAVLAFTFTCSTARPSAAAIRCAHGRNMRRQARRLRNHGAVDVAQRQPCARTRRAASPAAPESAPLKRSSVSGKCVPMSPSPAAPSSASVMACSSTSASEWPSRPSGVGNLHAANDQLAPRHQRVHVPALSDSKVHVCLLLSTALGQCEIKVGIGHLEILRAAGHQQRVQAQGLHGAGFVGDASPATARGLAACRCETSAASAPAICRCGPPWRHTRPPAPSLLSVSASLCASRPPTRPAHRRQSARRSARP